MNEPIPAWYRLAISRGIARLASLQLGKTPVNDEMPGLTATWIETTWLAPARRELPEVPRGAAEDMMDAAFTLLGARVRWWPVPEQWIDALGAVRVPGQLLLVAPEPKGPPTPEERQAFKARLRALRVGNEAMLAAQTLEKARRFVETVLRGSYG